VGDYPAASLKRRCGGILTLNAAHSRETAPRRCPLAENFILLDESCFHRVLGRDGRAGAVVARLERYKHKA
jgi:hypothetical protein